MKETRSCIMCKKKAHKHTFLRIIADDGGNPLIDNTYKANTRGMYLCDVKECKNKLLRVKSLNKLVKIKVQEDKLKELFSENGGL